MTFAEIPYERPDFEAFKKELRGLTDSFKNASSAAEQIKIYDSIDELNNKLTTTAIISSIRHSINNNDEFYNKEQDYWDEYNPLYEAENTELYKAVLSSKYLPELKQHYPKQLFALIDDSIKSFDEKIIPDLQEENRLVSKYNRIKATAKIMFDGKEYTLPGLSKLCLSDDRNVRKGANDAIAGYYESHEAEIDDIYDKLVKLRDGMAKKLGYRNYVELGYIRMNRTDYNKDDVASYRKQILEEVTPLVQKIGEEQRERLGYDHLYYYDAGYVFNDGMPKPLGTPEEILESARKMYSEMSPETKEYFDFMMEHQMMDVLMRDGKENGAYCTFLPYYKAPFLFGSFNGTQADIETITHEAGHGFQIYTSRNILEPELQWPTYESCEIHSMSMEFFTYPWMKNFFGEGKNLAKYYYNHLTGAIKFLPYGVLVDHFQHEVYEHPEYTPAERKAVWRKLEKMYLPGRDFGGNDFYERGTWWYKQHHIFQSPFYYIDYTLAQVCALQFFVKMNDDYKAAWKDYYHLCTLGGTLSFTGLVKEAGLENPFEAGSLAKFIGKVMPKVQEFSDNLKK